MRQWAKQEQWSAADDHTKVLWFEACGNVVLEWQRDCEVHASNDRIGCRVPAGCMKAIDWSVVTQHCQLEINN
jgi:hypothetical protein